MELEGLKGKPVAEICTEHDLSQSQYFQGCDQFLANAAKAFEVYPYTRRAAHLEHATSRLKKLVGERTLA
jgi:hypothetical protein